MKTNELEVKIAEIISHFTPGGAGEANVTGARFKEIADAVDNAMKGAFYVPETLCTGWISVGAYVASHLDREQAIGAARALSDMQIRESANELSRDLKACPILGAAVRGAFKNTMLDLDAALKREPGKADGIALHLWAARMTTGHEPPTNAEQIAGLKIDIRQINTFAERIKAKAKADAEGTAKYLAELDARIALIEADIKALEAA